MLPAGQLRQSGCTGEFQFCPVKERLCNTTGVGTQGRNALRVRLSRAPRPDLGERQQPQEPGSAGLSKGQGAASAAPPGDQDQRSRQERKRKGRKQKTSIESPRANTGEFYSPPEKEDPRGPRGARAAPAGWAVAAAALLPPRPHSPAVSAAAGVPATPFR